MVEDEPVGCRVEGLRFVGFECKLWSAYWAKQVLAADGFVSSIKIPKWPIQNPWRVA